MEMFEPQLTLVQEPDGEYTLHALTITPSSCYSAGLAQLAPPPDVLVLPEVQPIMLRLRARRGPCLHVLTPVRHRVRNLRLGPQHGKTRISAFVMLHDTIVGSASARVDGGTSSGPTPIQTSDWYAWLDRLPPGPGSFHVTGTVIAPHPGYTARLVRAVPQGIHPADLLLDLVVDELPGFWPQVVTQIDVRYDEAPLAVAYTSALVRLPGGDALRLDVEEVF